VFGVSPTSLVVLQAGFFFSLERHTKPLPTLFIPENRALARRHLLSPQRRTLPLSRFAGRNRQHCFPSQLQFFQLAHHQFTSTNCRPGVRWIQKHLTGSIENAQSTSNSPPPTTCPKPCPAPLKVYRRQITNFNGTGTMTLSYILGQRFGSLRRNAPAMVLPKPSPTPLGTVLPTSFLQFFRLLSTGSDGMW
jgi:hypothetical protein